MKCDLCISPNIVISLWNCIQISIWIIPLFWIKKPFDEFSHLLLPKYTLSFPLQYINAENQHLQQHVYIYHLNFVLLFPFYMCIITKRILLQKPLTEGDILKALPSKETTFDSMIVSKILSDRGTNSLGDFEVEYVYDPAALKVINEWV